MKVIHKFGPLNSLQEYQFEVSKFSHFDYQNGELFMWAEIRKDSILNKVKTYLIVGTGMDYEITWKPVGSVVSPNGALVWHLLEEISWGDNFANSIF